MAILNDLIVKGDAKILGNFSGPSIIATKLSTNNVGAGNNPVYFYNGIPMPSPYTIEKSVPADAVFTDTITTVTVSGSGNAVTGITANNGALTVTKGNTFLTEHPTITKSTDTTSTASPAHGGTFTMVDSVTRDSNGHVTKVNTKTVTLPADKNTDTKVTQTVTTANAAFPLLLAPNGQTATTTTTSYFDSGVTLNPHTNTITANITGTASNANMLSNITNGYYLGTLTAGGAGHGAAYRLQCQYNKFGDDRFGLKIESGHQVRVDYATNSTYADSALTASTSQYADRFSTARTIALTGSVTGSGSFDGSGNLSIATTTNHTHSYLPLTGGTLGGNLSLAPGGSATEGGEIQLQAPTGDTSTSGVILDNWKGRFRIFGIPSKDGTSRTGTGSVLTYDPYTASLDIAGVKFFSTKFKSYVVGTFSLSGNNKKTISLGFTPSYVDVRGAETGYTIKVQAIIITNGFTATGVELTQNAAVRYIAFR